MSSLLKEAIVDAAALKEAALKNAEAAIIQKYSAEVKDTIDKLLEQDDLTAELGGDLSGEEMGDPGMGEDPAVAADAPLEEVEEVTEDDIPLASTNGLSKEVGVGLNEAPTEGENVEFNVNLEALHEAIQELQAELDEEIEITEEDLEGLLEDPEQLAEADPTTASAAAEDADVNAMDSLEDTPNPQKDEEGEAVDASVMGENEVEEISEDLIDAVMEKLTVDMGATLSGWAGRSSESMKWEIEKALAHRRSSDFDEEFEDLKKAHKELVFENNQIKEHNDKYKQTVAQLKENLQDINLSNARLLYTNRVLRNTSLNERQKQKIVEAISNAGSVTEAKTIYKTLQSTMETKQTKPGPQSLSEAIGSRPSFVRATRKESKPVDTLSDRMKKLAGIK
tara:strand:+ start:18117 stop:19301 length:1185 start_codon:yes stop_codon:yes gene_type:complete